MLVAREGTALSRRKWFGAEEIIGKLREAEVGLAQSQTVAQVSRRLGISEQTCYRWRLEYNHRRRTARSGTGHQHPRPSNRTGWRSPPDSLIRWYETRGQVKAPRPARRLS